MNNLNAGMEPARMGVFSADIVACTVCGCYWKGQLELDSISSIAPEELIP
jgi:hypothetical protein